jgi:hypothetical protein
LITYLYKYIQLYTYIQGTVGASSKVEALQFLKTVGAILHKMQPCNHQGIPEAWPALECNFNHVTLDVGDFKRWWTSEAATAITNFVLFGSRIS